MESISTWRQQWSNNVVQLHVFKGRNAQYRAQKDIILTLDSVQELDMERMRHSRFAKLICNSTLTCLILMRPVVNCLQGNFKARAELCEILSSIRVQYHLSNLCLHLTIFHYFHYYVNRSCISFGTFSL